MRALFEELDYWPTPIGALTLRRRRELTLGKDVYEIRLGDESLMSSLFIASEVALARLALADLRGPSPRRIEKERDRRHAQPVACLLAARAGRQSSLTVGGPRSER